MYLTTEQLEARLKKDWPPLTGFTLYLANLLDEAHAAGRREGIAEGRQMQLAEGVTRREPMTDEQIDAELAAAGICMEEARQRLRKMIDKYRT